MLDRLTENFDIRFAMPDEDMTSQDVQEEHEIFFILKGQCKVILRNDHGGGRVRTLKESQYFGEIGLFYDCERTATVKSHSYDMFASIRRSYWDAFCIFYPKMRDVLKQLIWVYQDKN